jgi:hypothetical protein
MLWEYINGGAELYHLYGFVKVTTADYMADDREYILDIYEFDHSDNAFGLYSAIRPEGAEALSMGVAGFVTGSSLELLKGKYLFRITVFEESDETQSAMRAAAAEIEPKLAGTNEIPALFGSFPSENVVAGSEQIHAESYLGFQSLDHVYARKYAVGPDTVTIFMMSDGTHESLEELAGHTATTDQAISSDLPLQRPVALDHSYYGRIIAGLNGDMMVGLIGGGDQALAFFSDWLSAAP